MTFHVPERHRVTRGYMASTAAYGNNGAFFLPTRPGQPPLQVIASDGEGWEHVSVSRPDRCPTWQEMCAVKALFWDGGDCVVQYHPPEHAYVNNHSRCLHMWRPVGIELPRPPGILVGDAGAGSAGMSTDRRFVHLDVNDSGGWRRVTMFDLDTFEDGDLEVCAQHLLELSANPKLKARIIPIEALSSPLLIWTAADGWREWVHPADRVAGR